MLNIITVLIIRIEIRILFAIEHFCEKKTALQVKTEIRMTNDINLSTSLLANDGIL